VDEMSIETLKDLVFVALGIAGYLVLIIWVFPKLGIRT
jgi:hypothetical protein